MIMRDFATKFVESFLKYFTTDFKGFSGAIIGNDGFGKFRFFSNLKLI